MPQNTPGRYFWDIFSCNFCILHPTKNAYILPNRYFAERILVPAIYDTVPTSNLKTIVTYALLLALLLASIWIYARLCNFDRETWSAIAIFELIAGNSTGRDASGSEFALLFSMTMLGFFCSGDLIFGLTSSAIDKKAERKIESFDDMQENNLTLFTKFDMNKKKSEFYDYIKRSKVKIIPCPDDVMQYQKALSDVTNYKNCCLSLHPRRLLSNNSGNCRIRQ